MKRESNPLTNIYGAVLYSKNPILWEKPTSKTETKQKGFQRIKKHFRIFYKMLGEKQISFWSQLPFSKI